jgi:hypothetical protein
MAYESLSCVDMLNPKAEEFDTCLMLLVNKKASCALPESTMQQGIYSLSRNPRIASLRSMITGDHFGCLINPKMANSRPTESTQSSKATGPCRICVSINGINLYLVSQTLRQCLNYCDIIAVIHRKIKIGNSDIKKCCRVIVVSASSTG